MDDHIIDNDDLQRQNPSWKPSEWIGCGKAFKEIPRCVAIEFERIQLLPPEAQSILPSEAQSPAAFYTQTNLPTWSHVLDTRDLWADLDFSSVEPSHMPATLVELPLLPNISIWQLRNSLGQAWLDGNKSIRFHNSRIDTVYYLPLWWIIFAERVRLIAISWIRWQDAIIWASTESGDEEPDKAQWRERTLTLLSSIVGWTGKVGDKLGDLTYAAHMADLLRNIWAVARRGNAKPQGN
ncbi:hypothetical protein GGX14DRAFT_558378 [Mycena pura]|uniref:Uncharacterized protein n=1 Tax=Mycena pura TaxID=153505 RepID=A0AAD6VTI0_9AGAR|nr:hypothetical protein GGX14DRAFT_558378 [Mycena pura]